MKLVRTQSGGDWDLSSGNFIADPYPTYQKLLEDAPLLMYEKAGKGYLFASKYSTLRNVFAHPNISSSRVSETIRQLPDPMKKAVEPLTTSLSRWIVFLDPPKHTKIRKVVTSALSKKIVDSTADRIASVSEELISEFLDNPSLNLMDSYCFPLPAIIIAEMLGVPVADLDKIKAWSNHLAAFLGSDFNPALLPNAQKSIIEFNDYLMHLVKEHREAPRENLMSALLKFQMEENEFSDEDLVSNCAGLVFAGHETTTNLIGSSIFQMTSNKEVFRSVMSDQSKVADLVNEVLRFEAPVQRLNRIVKEPFELDGVRLETGQDIYLLIGAANRDPEVFKNPNDFSLSRRELKHIGFGFGRHLCPGAYLAQMEAIVAIKAISKHLSEKAEITSYQWRKNLSLRGLSELKLQLEA